MNKKIWTYSFNIGKICIASNNIGISRIFFENTNQKISNDYAKEETPMIYKASKQIEEYFYGERKKFEIPLSIKGTDFQNKVWNKLKLIPYGEIRTYKNIAEKINLPKAYRAVGMANNKNPICIIIPCHRVVGSNNSLIGYAAGIKIKKYLLDLENINGFFS